MAPRPLVSRRFHELFHSPPGVLFSVRSPYSPLSVYQEYLALESGLPRFTPGVTGLALLRYRIVPLSLRLQASHLSRAPFQALRLATRVTWLRPYNPEEQALRFGLVRVRSPLLAESRLISFPQAT